MKFRHAVAFVLVGWYLMLPPISENNVIGSNAPVSQWSVDSAYDAAKDCDRAQAALKHCAVVRGGGSSFPAESVKQACGAPGRKLNESTDQEERKIIARIGIADMFSQCISTDDPRLR